MYYVYLRVANVVADHKKLKKVGKTGFFRAKFFLRGTLFLILGSRVIARTKKLLGYFRMAGVHGISILLIHISQVKQTYLPTYYCFHLM